MTAPVRDDLPLVDAAPVRAARRKRWLLLVWIPLLAGLIGAFVYAKGGRYVETDNAYVKASKVPVSGDVAGTVLDVLVQENDAVVAGQVLYRLDQGSFEIAVRRAEARLQQVRTDLAALQAAYREKEAEITLVRTRHAFALKDQKRQSDLVARNFVSASSLDAVAQSVDLSAQQITALERDLNRIAQTLGGSVDLPTEQHASFLEAQAELDQAKLDLQRSEIRASQAGVVSKPPKRGQYLAAGATAMALVVTDTLWIEANFPEKDLTYMQPGQPVAIDIDTFPGQQWSGVVESLSPATGAEFSVLPAQNATGNWVKIAQRVAVRIALTDAAELPALRSGMSAVVVVDTGHRRRLLGYTL
jgi:membrane fusion protein, multidrug efflux system